MSFRLKKVIPPDTVTDFTAFPPLPYPYSGAKITGKTTLGHVSKDGTWSWVARDSVLDVFTTSTKERYGSWCFGAVLKRDDYVIIAIEELCSPWIKFPCLLVAVNKGNGLSFICMFNPRASKVIKVIDFPYKITSIEVVSGEGGASVETNPLCAVLRCMFGVIAIGTQYGHLALLDLCLDQRNFSDEISPNTVTFINSATDKIPERRELCNSQKKHLCLALNDCHVLRNKFKYQGKNSLCATYHKSEVYISALKYVRRLASLAVGFNFAGVQIWSLQQSVTIELAFCVSSDLPVVKFEFQEPENDPRNFCYLWVVRGHHEGKRLRPCHLSVASLYTLSYEKKTYIGRFGYLYEGYRGYTKSFQQFLSNDPFTLSYNKPVEISSRLIMSRVLRPYDSLCHNDADENALTDELVVPDETSLFAMAWEVWPLQGDAPTASYLTIFDINQWYRAEMPSMLSYDNGDFCSFCGVFSLQAVTNKLDSKPLLDVNIIRRSILKFKCLTAVDEFFYPSALSFRTCCLSVHGALNANYLGSQRQLLNTMTRAGPNCLIEPKELYSDVLVNGLLNHMQDGLSIRHLSIPMQREVLMTMALEHNMSYFLSTCVISWNTNRYIKVGLTVKFFLEWAWKRIAHIKLTYDKLCQPLFNCSGQGIDNSTMHHLLNFQSQLKRISSILYTFQKSPDPKTEFVKQELALRIRVVHIIDLYFHVVTWLYYCHLLPEHAEGVELKEQEVSYPFSHLKKAYSERRSELQELHNSIGATDILLIDGLMAELGTDVGNLFASRSGSVLYPPPSIHAVIGSYLIDNASFVRKHQLLFYLILDMKAFLSDRQSHFLERLMKFPQAFNMSPTLSRLTHAFWLLDHKNFEAALSTLLDPMVCPDDIPPWCHTRILKSFLYQGHQKKALNYMNYKCPPRNNFEDIKMHLTVLLANGCIGQAFLFQRKFQSEEHFEDLLNHLFDSCRQMNALGTLLKLPLSTVEHAALVNYLNSSSDPKLKEMLVMYYLLHCCPLEAAEVNEKLTAEIPESDVKAEDHARIRSALVNAYLKTLPAEQKVLAQEIKRMASAREPSRKDFVQVKPEPLSVTITAQSKVALSYADKLRSVMENISSISMSSFGAVESRFTPNFVPFAPPIPFLRSPFTSPGDTKLETPPKVVFATPVPKRQDSYAYGIYDRGSPPKRARFMESLASRSVDPDRRKSISHLRAEVLSVLQTPPIFRKPSQVHRPATPEGLDGTPLSILKIARSGNPSDSSVQAASVSSNDAETSVDENEVEICDITIEEDNMSSIDDNQSKHLRFRDSSPQISAPDSKVEETISPRSNQQSDHTFSAPTERSFRVSPRRPLRDSDNSSSSDSSSDVFLPVKLRLSPPASFLPTTQNYSSNDRKHIMQEKKSSCDDIVLKPPNVQKVHPDVLTAGNDLHAVPSASDELLPEERKMSVSTGEDRNSSYECNDFKEDSTYKPGRVGGVLIANIKKVVPFGKKAGADDDSSQASSSLGTLVSSGESSDTDFEEEKKERKFRTVLKPAQVKKKVLESSDESGEKESNQKEDNISTQDKTEWMNQHVKSAPENSRPKSSTSQFTVDVDDERKYLDINKPPSMSGPYHDTRSRSRSDSRGLKDAVPLSMCEMFSPPQLSESVFSSSTKLKKKHISSAVNRPISNLIGPKSSTSQFTVDVDDERKYLDINKPPSMSGPYRGTRSRSRSRSGSGSLKDAVPRSMCEVLTPPQLSESASTSLKKPKNRSSGSGDADESVSKETLHGASRTRRRLRKGNKFGEIGDHPEYSFSDPNVSGDPKISEALASPPITPVPAFVFSPPLTRARLQRKFCEPLKSPYMSASSASPFNRKGKHFPLDPLLLDSSILIPNESVVSATAEMPRDHLVKKSVARKKKVTVHSQLTSSPRKSSLVSALESEQTSESNSRLNIARHSMKLRKAKVRRKSVKLW